MALTPWKQQRPPGSSRDPLEVVGTPWKLQGPPGSGSGPLVAEYGVKNIFESKPVNHSCMGPFPEGLKEKYQKSAEIGRKYPEGIEVI